MSSGDDVFTGEYFVSLKGYKIPHKSSDKGAFDVNNPPPPGTEDDIQLGNGTAYISPLALDKRPPIEKFEANPKITPNSNADAKTTKRSFLFMMPSAEGLPEELIKLFKPLCCDLCSAKLNSPSTARVHYESKNHEKKITSWLNSWTERTGEPLPKRQAVQGTKGPTGPNALHCDVCDLPLTSLQHAKQHEMGKKHKNAVAGRSKPSGPGYYDTNNKWVRTNRPDPSKTADEENPNRFQIGEAFLVQQKKIQRP